MTSEWSRDLRGPGKLESRHITVSAGDAAFRRGADSGFFWSRSSGSPLMLDATYVAFVPRAKRAKMRAILQAENTAPLTWRERRSLFGSEFYFSGPSELARKAQAYVSRWVLSA